MRQGQVPSQSLLDKVWEIDNHMEWHEENQGKLGNMAKCYERSAFGKLCLLTTNYVSSRQKLYKCGTREKSLKYNIDFNINYAGKNPNRFHAQRESFLHSKHEQTVIGIKYRESNESRKSNKNSQLMPTNVYRRKTLWMQLLWEGLQQQVIPHRTSENSYRREITWMQCM